MPVTERRDASFYAAVHSLLEQDGAGQGGERRDSDRLPYRCVQLLAPVIDGQLPDQSQFRHVQCRDLSQGGFSFIASERPTYDNVVIALGTVPFTFLSAEILHHVPLEDGSLRFAIGCRFTGRIEA